MSGPPKKMMPSEDWKILSYSGAGVPPEESAFGDVRRDGVKAKPVDSVLPDVGAGALVIGRLPDVMDADDDEPRNVQGARFPQGRQGPDRPDGGVEDGEPHTLVLDGRGVEEAFRRLGAEERCNGENAESKARGLPEPGQFHRSLLVRFVGRGSADARIISARRGFDNML
jgi:hypothetical protein